MLTTFAKRTILATAISGLLSTGALAGSVEVLHYWTSGGEAKSAAVLKDLLEKEGHEWKDFAVAGGGGESAMTVLKSRAVSGNPPSAAQIKGPDIQEWADLGFLTELDQVAGNNNWDQQLPQVVANVMKYDGHYVAVPVNVHRVNWIWANPEVLKQAGVDEVPSSWEELIAVAPKIKAAGFIPLAHGGQAWQDATLFEAVVLGVGGADFYQKAMVETDADALSGDTMVKVLDTFKRLRPLIDDDAAGREWNIATAMVINGKAAMQVMGDWAKGEFTAAGKIPGKDYVCAPAPGTQNTFTFNVDSFAMFEVSDAGDKQAQADLARLILEPTFQEAFNLNKGSIPVRTDLPMDKFDSCAKMSMNDFISTSKQGGLVPSMAHGMAVPSAVQGAIYDTVTNFFNSDDMTPEQAAEKLAKAVRAAI
ncbi:sugar ABC transporter substrate-binding protein [Marinobacterium zhoushanense]|uniref:Probable sugar-binding periplasmic protein n=1 Tax=Marinobacterium zhoushanense TaxID=1679163 RepID=A0ABQ1KEW7_9GAMM|nr:ABC transporter substrate-binding protein [Marinobacterium zhoushanense]GGB93911.1 sugar ABC transporter substrate-binding protein [Marinobacterium zhoushanense]